jgi:uncharacterized membrane protein YczE
MIARRLLQLHAGLMLSGFSTALRVRADLGLDPWGVLHEGLSKHVGLSFGTTVIIVGALVLALWAPLRQKPGIGTISNILVIGWAVDASLPFVPDAPSLPLRFGLLLAGILLTGLASAAYIGAGLGPGPRDGVMTAIVARTGWSIARVRTAIELVVFGAGWLLGGTVGIGTVLYALMIGPAVHHLMPLLALSAPPRPS